MSTYLFSSILIVGLALGLIFGISWYVLVYRKKTRDRFN